MIWCGIAGIQPVEIDLILGNYFPKYVKLRNDLLLKKTVRIEEN